MQVQLWRNYDNYERRYTEINASGKLHKINNSHLYKGFPTSNLHIQAPLEISVWASVSNYY